MQTKIFEVIKITLTLALLCLGAFFSNAQERNSGEFNSIRVSGAANVVLSTGESCSVKVEGNANDTSKIKTSIENGTLIISTKGNIKSSDKLKVTVSIKELKSLDLSGASEVKTSGELTVDKLSIQSSGAGDARLDLKANQISTEVSGAGNLHLSGSTNLLQAKISGAGELKAYNLVADSVTVKVSGSGTAKVNAAKSIKAEVSGAGNVIYKGEPVNRNVDISGAGSVRQAKGENEIEINESLKIDHGDTTKLRFGDRRIMIYGDDDDNDTTKNRDEVKSIWTGIELGVNGYLTSAGSTDLPKNYNFLELNYKKSLCINVNFWEQNFKLYKNYIALTTGGGLEFNRFFFDNNTSLQPLNDSVAGFTSGIDFKKNCLKASFVTVPLLLELNTNRNEKKSFHLAAGLIGAYNLSSKLKQVYVLNTKTYKNKVKDDYSLNPFKIAVTVRAGYGRFNFFGTYALTSFFKKKAVAPELYAFTVGVTLLHFD